MRRLLSLAALALPLTACAVQAAGQGDAPVLEMRTRAVEITAGELSGLKLNGALVLSAAHRRFGGFSGLAVRDGRMIAVSDFGWLLTAELSDGIEGLRPCRAAFQALRDTDGGTYSKSGGDAEGLALEGDGFLISFERDHRIMRYEGTRPLEEVRDRAFEALRSNSGMEALAILPDGGLLAIAEGTAARGFPMFLVRRSGEVRTATLPVTGRHAVTGADIGPDGRLYVLLRDYTPLIGVSIRIHRYRLGGDGFPDPTTREELAAFEGSGGIDNMEGIALWTDADGRTRLALISDDNYNALQRTLLMDFIVFD